jgi:hypothetical protein
MGMVALWLISFLPGDGSSGSVALFLVTMAAGLAGLAARDLRDATAFAVGSFIGTATGGLTQSMTAAGPRPAEVLVTAAMLAVLILVVAGVVHAVSAAVSRVVRGRG